MNNKKFYWIKLRTDFFNQEEIDFLLQQENGCEYVVLYQMLCLSTANNNGRLETKINEVIIPYDVKKIVRDCRYFDYDTVVVALELYKKLGLIYETEDKILKLTGYENMIGSESASKSAIKKREYRARLKEKDNNEDKKGTNCPTEYRDKSIEYRVKSIDIDNRDKISTSNIYDFIEKNFGRTLSPVEYEEISNWQDNELTRYAIKQAVLNGKYNIKYISRILENYKNNGIKSVQEAQQEEEDFKNKKNTRKTSYRQTPEEFDAILDAWVAKGDEEDE